MRIIAISGSGNQAGKTTFADKFMGPGVLRMSFADGVRVAARKLYPDYNWFSKDAAFKRRIIAGTKGLTARDILIEIGVGERLRDPDVWARDVVRRIEESDRLASGVTTVVIDDLRYINELEALAKAGRLIHFHVVAEGSCEEPQYDNEALARWADYVTVWTPAMRDTVLNLNKE